MPIHSFYHGRVFDRLRRGTAPWPGCGLPLQSSQGLIMADTALPRSCPGCGASVDAGRARCIYCGAAVREPSDDNLRKACAAFIQALESDLEGITSVRVLIGFLLCFATFPATYFVARWLGAGTAEAIVVTAFIGLGALVAAGLNLGAEQKRRFREVLRPQVDNFLLRNHVRKDQFLVVARETLKKGSTLLGQLDDLYG
jgi:hypothetical protein